MSTDYIDLLANPPLIIYESHAACVHGATFFLPRKINTYQKIGSFDLDDKRKDGVGAAAASSGLQTIISTLSINPPCME